jgi:hypothetical protein
MQKKGANKKVASKKAAVESKRSPAKGKAAEKKGVVRIIDCILIVYLQYFERSCECRKRSC